MNVSRVARSGLAGIACLLGWAAVSTAPASAAAGAPGSANQALARSLLAATRAGSARITVRFFSGSTTGRVVQDSGLHSGEQTVAIGDERASVVLTGGAAYISGNTKGLTSYFGLPGSLAASLAGRWVSIPPADPAFGAVTATVDLHSALTAVTPAGSLATGKRVKLQGRWARSISGAAPGGGGHATLFVDASAHPVPVEAVESGRAGTAAKGEIVTFSRWGERLHLATPSGSVPISALQAATHAAG